MTDMEFETSENIEQFEKIDGTIIFPNESGEFPDELFEEFVSQTDSRGGSSKLAMPLLQSNNGYYTLNINAFAQLVWEHRQYSAAQSFSPSHLEILRTVQHLGQGGNFVLYKDIVNNVDYSKQSVSQALRQLRERKLVKRRDQGVYSFNGFNDWFPPPEES